MFSTLLVVVLVPSIVGFASGFIKSTWLSLACSAAIPWLGLLTFLLYTEYFVPYRGGGASMWPIAMMFSGTAMAIVGFCVCALTRRFILKPMSHAA